MDSSLVESLGVASLPICATEAIDCVASLVAMTAGEVIGVDVGADTSALWLQVHFNALVTAATKGKLSLQLANITGTASGTHLLAGSNVVYKKW